MHQRSHKFRIPPGLNIRLAIRSSLSHRPHATSQPLPPKKKRVKKEKPRKSFFPQPKHKLSQGVVGTSPVRLKFVSEEILYFPTQTTLVDFKRIHQIPNPWSWQEKVNYFQILKEWLAYNNSSSLQYGYTSKPCYTKGSRRENTPSIQKRACVLKVRINGGEKITRAKNNCYFKARNVAAFLMLQELLV